MIPKGMRAAVVDRPCEIAIKEVNVPTLGKEDPFDPDHVLWDL